MKHVLILGATGQVGQELLKLALQHSEVSRVTAPTRKPLARDGKLDNPLIDFEALPKDASWWKADLVLCALGTTLRQAKSKAGFYRVDHDYVLASAELARHMGTPVFGFVSSLGANPSSSLFYLRVKGETEQALSDLGFNSLVLIRPSLLIGGPRSHGRLLESVGLLLGKYLAALLPKHYRAVTTAQVAHKLFETCFHASEGRQVVESENI